MSWENDQEFCQVSECEREILSKGLCGGHYSRLRSWGELRPEIPLQERVHAKGQVCKTEGCNILVKVKGYCNAHYNRWRLTGNDRPEQPIKPIRYDWNDKCSVDGCDRLSRKLGRCDMHYQRYRIAGTDKRPGSCNVCDELCSPSWDHDHNTGEFRGWLCTRCNLVLGSVNDDSLLLKKLISYLEER